MTQLKPRHLCCMLLLCITAPIWSADNKQEPVCIQGICMQNDPLPGYSNHLEQCPETYMLSHEKLVWGAPGGWVSQDRSLTTNIKQFLGAQWLGVQLGTVLCIYGGQASQDFNVQLHSTANLRVPKPLGKKWQDGQDIVSCRNTDQQLLQPSDCAFINKKEMPIEGDLTDLLPYHPKSTTDSP